MRKIIPIVLIILYMILFHVPVRNEFSPRLLSSFPVPGKKVSSKGTVPMLQFSGINEAGYVNEKGEVIFSYQSRFPVQTAAGYCLAMNEKGRYTLMNIAGESIADFEFDGTADLQDEALFVRSFDFRGLATYTKGGSLIWERQFGNPLTSYQAASGITAVGLSDGSVILLNSAGDIIYERKFEYPGLSCVYALALSSNADKLAFIHGNYPQFLHVIHKKDSQDSEYRDLLVEEIDSDFRENVFLFFSADEKTIAWKTDKGIGYYFLSGQKKGEVKADSEVISAVLSDNGSFIYFVTDNDGKKHVNFADLKSGKICKGDRDFDYLSVSLCSDRLLMFAGNKEEKFDSSGSYDVLDNRIYLYGLEKK